MQNFKFSSYYSITFLFFLVSLFSCQQEIQTNLAEVPVIPKPVSTVTTGKSFAFTEQTGIYFQNSAEELAQTGEYLSALLAPALGFKPGVMAASEQPENGNIFLNTAANDETLGNEGYLLDINEKLISISANSSTGVFYGIQTLRQLFPARIEKSNKQEGPWKIATGEIIDYPNYSYRGSMLDVSRNFFEVADLKNYIDLLAAYKLNGLHLHLSDDQGWRIEIKSWPNLANHGGKTEVGGGEGGFYSQEQYKDIVSYAESRHIMIIPEIDMPGHTNAALASYAELNCNGEAPELYTGTNVGFSTLCTDKEITYKFVDDVLGELAALTPGPYIHIGGDESHVTPMEDYIPFIEHVQEIVRSHNKIMIGWDEIAHAKLDSSTIVQFWARADNATLAVKQGLKVIMSPATKAYLDMQYDSTTELGLHWAAYIEVDSAYDWDPAHFVQEISRQDILGIEAPLWSETVTVMDEIEYMVFPRLPGIAEIGWTPQQDRNWEEYKIRLGKQGPRFEAMGINYYRSKLVPWDTGQ